MRSMTIAWMSTRSACGLLELATLEYPYNECRNAAQIYRKVTLVRLTTEIMPPCEGARSPLLCWSKGVAGACPSGVIQWLTLGSFMRGCAEHGQLKQQATPLVRRCCEVLRYSGAQCLQHQQSRVRKNPIELY